MAKWLGQLARYHGIEPSYQDGTRQWHQVPVSTLQNLLSQMGVHVCDLSDVKKALKEARLNRWRHIVDQVLVVHPARDETDVSSVLAHCRAFIRTGAG